MASVLTDSQGFWLSDDNGNALIAAFEVFQNLTDHLGFSLSDENGNAILVFFDGE